MLTSSSSVFENYAKMLSFQVESVNAKFMKNSNIVKINITSAWLHFQLKNYLNYFVCY